MSHKPQAFASDDPAVSITTPDGAEAMIPLEVPLIAPRPRRLALASLFWSAAGGLATLWLMTAVADFVTGLIARNSALGWIALVLAGSMGLALIGLAAREILAVMRATAIARLHAKAAEIAMSDDRAGAQAVVDELERIYAAMPETAQARSRMAAIRHDVIDGRDLMAIAERELLAPRDALARRAISDAARRVSVATALSPRAFLDVVIVGAQALRLIRLIASIYGGRPGLAGFVSVLRAVTTHLIVTGGMAVGDSAVQQILGHGVAARVSARLGEGVLNGLLTARVGLATIDVCRPLPFRSLNRPGLKEVAGTLLNKRDMSNSV
jgi:putative membrane protein